MSITSIFSFFFFFFFSSRRRHTRCSRDWSSDVCSSDLSGTPSSHRSILGPRNLRLAAREPYRRPRDRSSLPRARGGPPARGRGAPRGAPRDRRAPHAPARAPPPGGGGGAAGGGPPPSPPPPRCRGS